MSSLYSILKMIDDSGLDGTRKKKRKRSKTKIQKKTVPTSKTEKFHRKKHLIDNIILSTIGDREIIYGEQALKKHFPRYLERHTQDYDVYSPTPRKDARQAERKLDKRFGGDYFRIQKAQHPGTYKVVSNVNEEGYADFTKKPPNVPSTRIGGKRYVKLSYEKKKRQKILRDKNYQWRHGKDRDALNRIKIYEKKHRGK